MSMRCGDITITESIAWSTHLISSSGCVVCCSDKIELTNQLMRKKNVALHEKHEAANHGTDMWQVREDALNKICTRRCRLVFFGSPFYKWFTNLIRKALYVVMLVTR